MSPASRTGLRAARRALWYALALALVLVALALAVAGRLLPVLERNPGWVETWLAERTGQPVTFDALATEWTRRGPLLRLEGLRIGDGAGAVKVGAAEVLVAQYAGLLPWRSLTELRLRNLDLVLERDEQGRWNARGLPGQAGGGDPFSALERLGELQVIDGSLTIDVPSADFQATIPRVDLRMQVNGNRVRAAARAWMRDGDAPLRTAVRFDRGNGSGELYAGAEDAGFGAWLPLVRLAGITVEDGHGRLEAWAGLRDARIEKISSHVELERVALRSQAAGEGTPGRLLFDGLRAEMEWTLSGAGWRLDVPRLDIVRGGTSWRTEGLAVRVGGGYALVADRIEAAPLLQVLALSDRVTPGIRAWLGAAAANVVLDDVQLAGTRHGPARVGARVGWLAFDAVGDSPGLEGLRGELSGDGRGLVFAFDPRARLRFDWPSGFGTVHEVAVRGRVSVWEQGTGLQVQAPALRLDGEGYGADVRGGLWFQRGDGRPRIDLAVELDESRIPVAKRFWVRHRMSERAIAWLDAALIDGRVVGGRAVISGDLDDWPFDVASGRAARGVFHAEAGLFDATLQFQPQWPVAERLQGQVRFIADGFDFQGHGDIAGVPAEELEAAIADFGRAELAVTARTAADAGSVVALLRRSPLGIPVLAGLRARGDLEGSFAMQLPLHDAGRGPRIEGEVRLAGVRAAVPEWKLAVEGLRGALAYDEHGFAAPGLHAWYQGRPGRLSLLAGEGHVSAPDQAFEGELRTGLDASDLLLRAPELGWLRPHVHGRSIWSVGVTVPRVVAGTDPPPSRLTLCSDLVGTALDLPPPLRKPAGLTLSARVDVPLPLGPDEVTVRLGQRLSLRALAGTGAPAVSVALGGAVAAAPTAGLTVRGRARELAALEWAGLVAAGTRAENGEAGSGPVLQTVDLEVDRLLLAGGGFGNVHIGTGTGGGDDTRLEFEGPALAGHLDLPGATPGPLAGYFERLHWHRQGGASATAGEDTGGAPEEEGPDPALIPPIRLSVGDLRLDQARLGNATLATSRVEGGMRIDQLESQSSAHHVVASGYWTGRGGQARTQMEMRVASADFGNLLEGLGYRGHIRGGDGRLQMSAAWAGSPAGFRADRLDGALQLSLRDGQLVEVEPGAGRLLGLLSIAELPRRLSLDFRDFFDRGFAFNRIEGDIHVDSGQARSSNLLMDGPAATIHIAGNADLRAHSYDQTIEVLPKSGNVLTAVGALAGGPVGAAVGAVANAVLRRPLSELGSTTYRVTGPWQEPLVEVVRREPPRVAEGEPAPRQ